MSKAKSYFKVNHFEPLRSVQSNVVSPKILAIIRSIYSLFLLSVFIVLIIVNYQKPLNFGLFLTNYGYYGLSIYMWWSTYLSINYLRNPSGFSHWRDNHWLLHVLYHVLYECVILFHIIIPVVYWALLSSEVPNLPPDELFLTLSRHLFDFVLMASEFLLGRNLIYINHFPIVLGFGILYICLALLLHNIYGVWSYPFLNYIDAPVTFAVTLVAIIVVGTLYYFFSWYLHSLRDRLFKERSARINDTKVYP